MTSRGRLHQLCVNPAAVNKTHVESVLPSHRARSLKSTAEIILPAAVAAPLAFSPTGFQLDMAFGDIRPGTLHATGNGANNANSVQMDGTVAIAKPQHAALGNGSRCSASGLTSWRARFPQGGNT